MKSKTKLFRSISISEQNYKILMDIKYKKRLKSVDMALSQIIGGKKCLKKKAIKK